MTDSRWSEAGIKHKGTKAQGRGDEAFKGVVTFVHLVPFVVGCRVGAGKSRWAAAGGYLAIDHGRRYRGADGGGD